jgi:thiol-disulfide isomerase/thioredoxin
MNDGTEGSTSLLERPAVRLAIAVLLLAGLAALALLTQRGGTGAPKNGDVIPPSVQRTATDEVGLGAIGDRAPIVHEPAPDFVLRDLDGRVVKLSDLKGNVVWVNFWASWCIPCKRELPDIQKLYDEKRDAGLMVLEVNYQEDSDTARGFFEARSLKLTSLLDNSGSVYEEYRLQGLPDSFFVDRDGNLAAMQFGFLTEAKMRERLAAAGLP